MGFLVTLVVAACGGGGGGNSPAPTPPVTPPSGLSYTAAAQNYTVGTAITALNPTVTGTVTGYAISPALPAGITINSTSGVISGTPTAAQATTSHTITASNAGGSTTASISVTVIDVAPSIGYPQASYTFTTETGISPLAPTSTAGTVVSWSIDQALPAGLAFSTTTGQITGTPTATSAATTYRVTGVNSGGSDFFDVEIAVRSGVLVELGHNAMITKAVASGTRVMTIDQHGRTRLFNAQTGSPVVRSEPSCGDTGEMCGTIASLAGNVLVARSLSGFRVYDAQTGALIAEIAEPAGQAIHWDLAADGGYVINRTITEMRVWSTATGALLFTRSGNYAGSHVFAAAGEIRVAAGPAGDQVVEYISVPGNVSTSSAPFLGEFHSWSDEGSRFYTNAGNQVVVYSSAGAQLGQANLPTIEGLAGHEDFFWTYSGSQMTIYRVGAGNTPVGTFQVGEPTPVPYTDFVSSASGVTAVLIDLSGVTPTRTDYPVPTLSTTVVAAGGGADWIVGDQTGVVWRKPAGEPPVRFTRGRVSRITGGDTRFAIAFADGNIEYYDAGTQTLQGEFSAATPAPGIQLSRDGSVLAVDESTIPASSDRPLKLYSLPSETLLAQWPANPGDPYVRGYSLSDDGTYIAQDLGAERRVVRIDGSLTFSQTSIGSPSRLSPSGTRLAFPGATEANRLYDGGRTLTSIYENTSLVGTVTGWGVDWVDEDRVLVNLYPRSRPTDPYGGYGGAILVNIAGQLLTELTIPHMLSFQRLDANSVYSSFHNSIFSLTDGSVLWHDARGGGEEGLGAVAGDYVVYGADAFVRADPR